MAINLNNRALGYAREGVVSLPMLIEHQQVSLRHSEILLRGQRFDRIGERDWLNWYAQIPYLVDADPALRSLAINIDSEHLFAEPIYQAIMTLLYRLCEQGVEVSLEWTEHHQPVDLHLVAARFSGLRERFGVEIHLDDVGAPGVDALARCVMVAPDLVKIDGELFAHAKRHPRVHDALGAHIEMYHKMLIDVVIEWVESPQDLRLAHRLGADFAQGFVFNGWTCNEPELGRRLNTQAH